MTRSNKTRIFTFLVVLFTTFQGVIPQLTSESLSFRTTLSACIMFAVVILTALKQFYSVEIRNGAIWSSLCLGAIAILGGANDFFNAVPLNPRTGQWVRLLVTVLGMTLTIASKSWFPTAEGKEVERMKEQLAP